MTSPQNVGRRGRTPHANPWSETLDMKGMVISPRQGPTGRVFTGQENAHPMTEKERTDLAASPEGRE